VRRVLLAIGGTVAGLAILLSFKSHGAPGLASVAAGTSNSKPYGQAGGTASAAAGGTASGAGSSTGVVSTDGGARVITGNVANTAYGPVQIQVTLKQNKITKVTVLEQPQSTQNDIRIGDFAFPKLIQETLAAQSSRIDVVSGATYTSGGYIKSLQSVLDNGA
jgi:uncharacterized protein with FMN-binding domain